MHLTKLQLDGDRSCCCGTTTLTYIFNSIFISLNHYVFFVVLYPCHLTNKWMSRKLVIIAISILVLFTAIFIAVVLYYYNIIDVTKIPEPPIDAPDDRIKTTKIGMIYQTKIAGDEWFMDPSKLIKIVLQARFTTFIIGRD